MSENKNLDLTEGGSTAFKMVPYLRLTAAEDTYTLSALVTVPSTYEVGACTVTPSGDAVTVDIPVTSSGTSEHWKAVFRTCTIPAIGGGITTNSIVTVNVKEATSITGGVGDPISQGSSKVTYEDAEDE